MACYYPIDGWRSEKPNDNGKYPIVFSPENAALDQPLTIACGRCIGCRLTASRNWAIRCVHESSLYDDNCFITLTYDDEHLPENASLKLEDFQLFIKKFRAKFAPKTIRFFMCGEYGEDQDLTTTNTIGRPHFHALIFNYDFPDQKIYKTTNDNSIYTSNILDNLWGNGFTTVGALTFETAAYVARYCLKKITGDGDDLHGVPSAEEHYRRPTGFDLETCETTYTEITPEFTTMSRGHRCKICKSLPEPIYNCPRCTGGIGFKWFQKYHTDLNKDFLVLNGVKLPSPKYYDKLFESYDDGLIADIKSMRSQSIDSLDLENKSERLRVKEQIKKTKLKLLSRALS